MTRLAAATRLARWLSPLADEGQAPADVTRSRWILRPGAAVGPRAAALEPVAGHAGERLLDAAVFTPARAPLGLYVVAPGLHFLGPDDPRFDRFARVLAHAGFVVVAPYLPDYLELVVRASAVDDFEAVVRAASDRFADLGPPTLFSISFGSYPALVTAARLGDSVDGVVTFGGYASFEAAVRFCVDGVMQTPEGGVTLARDPLNQPALFLNLLPHLDLEGDTTALAAAYRAMCHRTWGKPELKEQGRLVPFAEALEGSVPPAHRAIFRVGCGVEPGGREALDAALVRGREALAHLDPAAALAALRRPLFACHGRDDDVIPWNEAHALAATANPAVRPRALVTGLYAHTGRGTGGHGWLDEARTMGALLSVLSDAGRLHRRLPPG